MTRPPRILFAGLFHETHCFTPDRTDLADFQIERGVEILNRRLGDGSQIDGFLQVAAREGWEVVPTLNYTATPSGLVTDAVVAQFCAELAPRALEAAAGGVDAIYLSLHGAMVSESHDDVEGLILSQLRAIPGLTGVPLFGVFDLHANFSPAMAALSDGLVCYRENPHIDAYETGMRAADLLARCLKSGLRPVTLARNLPILWPPTGTGTQTDPMRALCALARELEGRHPEIWAINVVAGFSFADANATGVALSVLATDTGIAGAALDSLAALADTLKPQGLVAEEDPDDILGRMTPNDMGPVILVEPSDNIGGGAPGTGTSLLRAFLRHRIQGGVVVIADAPAVAELATLAPGDSTRLTFGARDNPFDPGPVTQNVTLISRSDGQFTLEDRNSHLAASQGIHIDMGPCATLRCDGVTILLTSRKTPPFDLGQLRSQGIVPETARVIAVKAAVAHRRAYDPIAAAQYWVRTPGACGSDPRLFPYRRLRRPIFPLDAI